MSFMTLNKTKSIIIIEAIVFFLLIAFGISGSSISILRSWAPSSISMDDQILIGHPKGIRSDEWAVNSLLAIGQYQNKESKNPRMNSNLGPTPRDMSIIHDIGVPTSELSTVSKMNLWGFFMFDLRRALAWDWWIPVFVGLNGIWLLLNLLCPGQNLFNFSLALLFTLAPECVMWSNWPLMHVGVASFAVSFAILALTNNNAFISLILAMLTGLLVSWFALQLYLPRLIPVALISVGVYAGYCITSRVKFFTKGNCLFIVYAALIASSLLFDWFYHNYDAISRMLNSSYPGQRRIYGGVPVSGWDFNYVRGWLFPITGQESFFANYQKIPSNSCEAMSYIGLFIPVIFITVYYLFKNYKHINYVFVFVFAFLLFFIGYEYIGLPEIIGKLTFINRSAPGRSIIGVGFTTLILLAFLYKYRSDIKIRLRFVLLCICLLPFVVFFLRNNELVDYLEENYFSELITIVMFIVFVHVVLIYRIKYIALSLLLFMMPVTLFWNPLIVAPSYLSVSLPQQLNEQADLKYNGRLLVADGGLMSNVFFASGQKVMNGTSHYVDPYMFDDFYTQLDNKESYNRFNHLMVSVDNLQPDIGISQGGIVYSSG